MGHLHKYLWIMLPLLFSCSGKLKAPQTEEPLVVFPVPPDTTRIQFLTTINSARDIVGKKSAHWRYILGPQPDKPIFKPYGLTLKKDKIFICDSMLPGLEIIDLKKASFNYFTPTGLGALQKPLNCDLDSSGQLYISDAARKQVLLFDAERAFQSIVGNGLLQKPTDVKLYQNKIWICDLGGHQIKVFDQSNQQYQFAFPDTTKNKPEYLFAPTNLDVFENKVYVSDTGDARVKVYNLQGNYLYSIGRYGNRPGQFVRPKGVAVDQRGYVYVVDAAFENTQIFNPDRQVMMYFGKNTPVRGKMWLPAGISIDYQNIDFYKKYVYAQFDLKYLIFVANQYGPDRINVYGYVDPKIR